MSFITQWRTTRTLCMMGREVQLSDLRNVIKMYSQLLMKIGMKQQRIDYFDRFFVVDIGNPDGV